MLNTSRFQVSKCRLCKRSCDLKEQLPDCSGAVFRTHEEERLVSLELSSWHSHVHGVKGTLINEGASRPSERKAG